MSLNHINLVVKNVDNAGNLFTDYFGFSVIVNHNSKMAVLDNDKQFALVILGQELNKREDIPEYPENFHIGFYQEDQEAVWIIYKKLQEQEGLRFEAEPKNTRNTFGFYFYFENLMIEISVNPFNAAIG